VEFEVFLGAGRERGRGSDRSWVYANILFLLQKGEAIWGF
jgi:hypothetical protein